MSSPAPGASPAPTSPQSNTTSPPRPTPHPPPPAPSTPPSSTKAPPPSKPYSGPPPRSPSGGRSPPPPSVAGTPPLHSGRRSPPPHSGRVSHPPPPTSRSPPSSGSGITTGAVMGIAVGGVLLLMIFSLMCICCKKKKKIPESAHQLPPPSPGPKAVHNWHQNDWLPPTKDMAKPLPPPAGASVPPHTPPYTPAYISSNGGFSSNSGTETVPSHAMSFGLSKSTFSYEELAMATDGFSDSNLLGEGGFGYVHRGVLPNSKEVAVKQLKVGSGQGEREFQAEVETISRVHHKHLVSLVGYSVVGVERMLVYEFVPNNTLEFHLHGKGRPVMNWSTRMKIALGAAKGLAYLHEDCHPKIIHRDIKASNILLEHNFEAKVADFGLAKFFSDSNTHVSTRVMGTFGYLAPEYASSGKLTEKSDVFSYGVVLLELITGKRPVNNDSSFMDDSFVDWAKPFLIRALEDGNFDVLVDKRIQSDYNRNEMTHVVACAAACVHHSSKLRPKMSQVVRALEGDASLSDLNEGVRQGQSTASSDYDTFRYKEDMKKFKKMAMSSQEYGSSSDQYSNPTSEYGLNPSGSSSEGLQTAAMKMGTKARAFVRGS